VELFKGASSKPLLDLLYVCITETLNDDVDCVLLGDIVYTVIRWCNDIVNFNREMYPFEYYGL